MHLHPFSKLFASRTSIRCSQYSINRLLRAITEGGSDFLIPAKELNKKFSVIVSPRQDCKHGNPLENYEITIFTDGSKWSVGWSLSFSRRVTSGIHQRRSTRNSRPVEVQPLRRTPINSPAFFL